MRVVDTGDFSTPIVSDETTSLVASKIVLVFEVIVNKVWSLNVGMDFYT